MILISNIGCQKESNYFTAANMKSVRLEAEKAKILKDIKYAAMDGRCMVFEDSFDKSTQNELKALGYKINLYWGVSWCD